MTTNALQIYIERSVPIVELEIVFNLLNVMRERSRIARFCHGSSSRNLSNKRE